MINQYKTFLETKFGKEITEKLYREGRLDTTYITETNNAGQAMVYNHLKDLIADLKFSDINSSRKWAFDFPGWTDELNFNQERRKKYMIIGLEPHIDDHDFQIAYGLSDYTNDRISNKQKPRFQMSESESSNFKSADDSTLIWSNIFKLLANDKTKQDVLKRNDHKALMSFLNQFYVTDLCHFAPLGKAKEIKKIIKWSKVRFATASDYLKKEIELINPEYIITQGNGVFNIMQKILNFESKVECDIPYGKHGINIKKASYNKATIISLPHIGSKLTNKTFWIKNLDAVADRNLFNNISN